MGVRKRSLSHGNSTRKILKKQTVQNGWQLYWNVGAQDRRAGLCPPLFSSQPVTECITWGAPDASTFALMKWNRSRAAFASVCFNHVGFPTEAAEGQTEAKTLVYFTQVNVRLIDLITEAWKSSRSDGYTLLKAQGSWVWTGTDKSISG